MPPTTARVRQQRSAVSPHVGRLVEFIEPRLDDDCLDLAWGRGPLPAALAPLVRQVTAVDVTRPEPDTPGADGRTPTVLFGRDRLPGGDSDGAAVRADAAALPCQDGSFSLVTARFAVQRTDDPAQAVRELVRVCRPGGRVVIAESVRPSYNAAERDRLEKLHDPASPGLPTIDGLARLLAEAGAQVRRLDRHNVERPLEPWLAGIPDPRAAERIRRALLNEVDGGPRTGARPRVISGEIWFTQTWAALAGVRV